MRRFFDPKRCRMVLFDQRGCGRSTPHAALEDNTTWDLVADIERIRERLGIERWLVFGGSWGSTLALAYAVTHPDRCAGLLLRGVFLLTEAEIRWFYQDGASHLFPDAFERFQAPIPLQERGDFVSAFYRRLTSSSRTERIAAARAWGRWEGETISFLGPAAMPSRFNDDRFIEAFARIECHYFKLASSAGRRDTAPAGGDRAWALRCLYAALFGLEAQAGLARGGARNRWGCGPFQPGERHRGRADPGERAVCGERILALDAGPYQTMPRAPVCSLCKSTDRTTAMPTMVVSMEVPP
jgi:pimeloyl-ACP methyl ester carboxylesterase